jgi:uncharacterized protein YodC (DUF2158 family)
MAERFKIGDVVKLKSDGPKMTVVRVDRDAGGGDGPRFECAWFTAAPAHQYGTGSFPGGALDPGDENRPRAPAQQVQAQTDFNPLDLK